MSIEPLNLLSPRHNARTFALAVLGECGPDVLADDVIRRHAETPAGRLMPAVDRRLATHLIYGVLRRRGTLEALLAPLINREPDSVEPWLRDALMLGAFQLCLMTQVPPHAALNETVELAGHYGRLRGKGFLNGVLRACSQLVTAERVTGPAADALPLENGSYRRLTRPIFADPEAKPMEYYARAFSLPGWLASRRLEREGKEEAFRLGFVFASAAPTTVRVDERRVSRDDYLRRCLGAGFKAEAGRHPQCVRLREHPEPHELPGFAEGWIVAQDESAMDIVPMLAPTPGMRVLAACGDAVRTHLEEAGAVAGDVFDAAVVEAPSTGTAALASRPERRHALRIEDLRTFVARQRRLLTEAAAKVRPGGVIVYATTSMEPEENGELVRGVANGSNLVIEAEETVPPGRPGDGGYRARLRVGGQG